MSLSREHGWLLRAALGPAPACVEAWQAWAASVDLDAVDHASQRLLPLVWRNLSDHGAAAGLPGRVVGHHRYVWSRNQLVLRRLEDTLVALRRGGVTAAVLDDAGLLLAGYPDAGCRPVRGLDLLVTPPDVAPACAALRAADWRPRGSRTPAFEHAVQYALALEGPGGEVLRLHRFGLRDEWSEPAIEAALWAGAREASLGPVTAVVLAPGHALVRLLGQPPWWEPSEATGRIADVVRLLGQAGDRLDWPEVLRLAGVLGVRGVLAGAMTMAREVAGLALPGGVMARLGEHTVSRLERLARQGRSVLARLVARHGLEYWRLARRAGWRRAMAGYPRYLRHRWALRADPWQHGWRHASW